MRHTSLLLLSTLSLVALTGACAAPDEEEAGDDASEVTKRTAPKAGMGGVVLDKPAWYDPATFGGAVRVAGPNVATELVPGKLLDLAPAAYTVYFRPLGMPSGVSRGGGDLYTPRGHEWKPAAQLAAGTTWTIKPAGLRLELDRPFVFERAVSLGRLDVQTPASFAFLNERGAVVDYKALNVISVNDLSLAPSRTRVDVLLPPGAYTVTLWTTPKAVALADGQLVTLPIKTLTNEVSLDPIDPAFPDSAVAACATLASGWSSGRSEPVRKLTAMKTAVLPDFVPVTLEAFGLPVPEKITGNVRRFALNRLELDDVEVSSASSPSRKVKGTAFIEVKTASGWQPLTCRTDLPGITDVGLANGSRIGKIPTSTGLDVPDGTYRITSTATGPNGNVSHTEEISFP